MHKSPNKCLNTSPTHLVSSGNCSSDAHGRFPIMLETLKERLARNYPLADGQNLLPLRLYTLRFDQTSTYG